MNYYGSVKELPESAKAGQIYLYNDKLYVYTNGWENLESSLSLKDELLFFLNLEVETRTDEELIEGVENIIKQYRKG